MTAHATFTANRSRNLSVLEDTLTAARKAGPDSARVLFEALRRTLDDDECSEVLDALQAIWRADPAGAWENGCPHYTAKHDLATAARDIVDEWDELTSAPSYRISGDASCTGYFATFRSVRGGVVRGAAE